MILAALLIAVSTPASVAAARPSPVDLDVEAVHHAVAALGPHLDGTWLDGKPGTASLAEAQWHAVQIWTAHWLDSHPGATPAALKKASAALEKDEFDVSATSLGHSDMLVSVTRWQMGNAFILGRGNTGYRLRWSAATRQARLNPAADRALSYWRPDVQNTHCNGDCRMMASAGVERLPDAANGAARFAIEASYAQEAGGTFGAQLSLWSWQGGRARPLLVHDYTVSVDQGGGGLRGSILHVSAKGEWSTLFGCGGCAGRDTDLRFAIEPGRVRMLAPVSRTPELDLVDRLFSRVLAHRPAGALASPSALRVIRRQLGDSDSVSATGMVMGWARWRTHGVRWACLSSDNGGAMAFAFDASLTRITEAHVLPGDGCQGTGYRM